MENGAKTETMTQRKHNIQRTHVIPSVTSFHATTSLQLVNNIAINQLLL